MMIILLIMILVKVTSIDDHFIYHQMELHFSALLMLQPEHYGVIR